MPYRNWSATDLVRACVGSADPEIWNEFVARFQPTIAGVALRTARRWGETSLLVVEDLVQETFLKLCADDRRLLRVFEPRHERAFFGYLKVIAGSVGQDYFKRLHTDKREPGGHMVELPLAGEKVEVEACEQIEREALLGEIERRLSRLTLGPSGDRDCDIFWMYYRVGMSARAIAELPGMGLTIKGVESTILRLTRLLRAELAGSGPEMGFAEVTGEPERGEKGNLSQDRSDK